MLAHAFDGLPDESCGLMVGRLNADSGASDPLSPGAVAEVTRFERCRNAAESSRIYSIDPKDLLRIERDADDDDLDIVGVMHSHTHTEPYPSVTDVNQAPDPSWHFVIVSLRDVSPILRSYRIIDGEIIEEPVVVTADA